MLSRIAAIIFIAAAAAAVSVRAQPPEAEPAVRQAFDYGFVVDNSGSMRLVLERVIKLVGRISDKQADGDRAFFVTFVDVPKTVLRQELTSDASEIRDAAENMFIEGGQTAMLDAVRASADYLIESTADSGRRRALILVTDGDERESAVKLDGLAKLLRDANIRIFAIGIAEGKVGGKILDRITKETGGIKFTPGRTDAEVEAMVNDLLSAMRSPQK